MAKSTKPPPSEDEKQSRAFIDKARELGADKDTAATDAVMRHLGTVKQQPPKSPRKPAK
ncbi:MAG: hypothetical protein U1E56_09150 [Bauldia sp.]